MSTSDITGLSVEGLAVRRAERLLLRDVSFSLRPGEVLQVEGHNGCGKTTMLRVICGLTRPAAGTVRWCGEDIRDNFPLYASHLSYVGHNPGVKEELTPIENLTFAAALRGVKERSSPAQALKRMGLPMECVDIPCRKLSAGQRRRVALARLLSDNSLLWVLDEPFTALDAAGRALVEKMLSAHAAEGGMAVVTSHHEVVIEGCATQRLHLG